MTGRHLVSTPHLGPWMPHWTHGAASVIAVAGSRRLSRLARSFRGPAQADLMVRRYVRDLEDGLTGVRRGSVR